MANRLTIKGQVTIPKDVREFLGLQAGASRVEFTIFLSFAIFLRPACF